MGQDAYDLAPLLARAKEGEQAAFLELLVDFGYEQEIRTMAREYLPQIPEYDEERLFQELVVYAWQAVRHDRFERFDRWLRRILHDNCRFITFKARFINGDGNAFQEYETLVRRRIRRKFAKISRNGYEDDVVQNVKLRVWQTLSDFRKNAGAFKYYLYETTKGFCHKIIENPATNHSPDVAEASVEDQLSEEIESVRHAIRLLPEKYKKPLVLKECLAFTHQEIADILSIPRGTSQVRVQRGKTRLKALLENGDCH